MGWSFREKWNGQERGLMKKRIVGCVLMLFMIVGLSGCNTAGEKASGFSVVYGAAAVISLLLLIGCCCFVFKKKTWFILLFSSVLVVNIGYTILSVSSCLEMALYANRIAYLGSVFLPLSMLMIILDVTNTRHSKWLTGALLGVAAVVFLIAASPGILGIYYKEVSFAVVGDVSTLVKVYGPLHPLYMVYLLGYFVSMIMVIIRASVKRTIESTSHSVILVIAVFANIGVWLIEQLFSFNFEFLSMSYIISELFLLGVHLVVNENQRLKELVRQKDETIRAMTVPEAPKKPINVSAEMMEFFISGVDTLTLTERTIYHAYLEGTTTKEIMSMLNIKENTLKFHNKNIYSKLGVSSRKQLLAIHRAIEAEEKKRTLP